MCVCLRQLSPDRHGCLWMFAAGRSGTWRALRLPLPGPPPFCPVRNEHSRIEDMSPALLFFSGVVFFPGDSLLLLVCGFSFRSATSWTCSLVSASVAKARHTREVQLTHGKSFTNDLRQPAGLSGSGVRVS